ncbi:coiled-coil domain-containing protein 33 isoform X3 [Alosa sapidissima]|nr:coiled-coil domain-containing protein 33 isoform X3 [Alosa sapidissima]
MTDPLKNPVGPLLAVARIVADYDLYRDTILLHSPSLAGIAVTLIPFPDPPESAFSLLPLTTHGRPQVSPAGCPQQRPVWRHSFLFLGRDCATVFTPGAALVLELYPTTTVMNSVSWHLRSPVGFCMLFLDQGLYRKLMSERGHRGFRVPQLPLQGSHLQTTTGSTPSVSIVLRLIGSERPDSILTEADTSLLPCLDSEQQDESASSMTPTPHLPPDSPTPPSFPSDPQQEPNPPTSPPLHVSIDHLTPPLPDLQRESFGLPSYDALAQILPEYQHLLRTVRPEKQDQGKTDGAQSQRKDPAQINHTYDIHGPNKRPPIPDFQDSSFTAEVTEQQNKELENYRTAMCKMAEDIIALRTQQAALEAENSHLRSALSLHQEVGHTLLQDTDVDVMTKAEITDRIASLKVKLASETSKAASQRDKIQQLQNELIKKNDHEKELERLRRAHQQQQAVLHRYQSHGAKMAGLETTVRQQEKVIEKMEKVLDTKLRERNKENTDRKKLDSKGGNLTQEGRKKEIECVLAAENARLREELERMRYQPPPVILQQPTRTIQVFPDREKFSLLSQLERAEARMHTLEHQLKANAREWGREKQSLTTKLREQEHGFARTSAVILHDLPAVSTHTHKISKDSLVMKATHYICMHVEGLQVFRFMFRYLNNLLQC